MFSNMNAYFTTPKKLKVAEKYKKLFTSTSALATDKDHKDMYEALIKGDPKLRSYRAVYQNIYTRYIEVAKREQPNGGIT